jgi:hypothetical protein
VADFGPDPRTIAENIARAKERRDAALIELEAATKELQWWRAGLAMFDPGSAAAEHAEERADAQIRDVIPEGFGTMNPSIRQLILFAMRAEPHGDWPIARIFDVLVMHGWLHPDDEAQVKRITDMTALMARENLLLRADRGVYRLPDDLAAALSRALRPITDYRIAARHGMPVPERPVVRARAAGRRATASDIRTPQSSE